jgi:plastocyanin
VPDEYQRRLSCDVRVRRCLDSTAGGIVKTFGALSLVVLLACGGGGGDDDDDGGVVNPPGPAPATATVTMSATSFTPATTTVRVGGTVSFVNSSGVLHDVDFGTPALFIAAFDAGSRSLTFPTAGTLTYHCNLHAGMEATLIVR